MSFTWPTPVAAAAGSSARKTETYELCSRCLASLNDHLNRYKTDPKQDEPGFGKRKAGA